MSIEEWAQFEKRKEASPALFCEIPPLICAVREGYLPIVQFLVLETDIPISHKNHEGISALEIAAVENKEQIWWLLMHNLSK